MFSMSSRRKLTRDERLAIIRESEKGVSRKALAAKFDVTERTIYYTLRTERERRRESSIRTRQVSVTVTEEELQAFDAVLGKHGITSRSDGMRRLIQSANGIFIPDEHLASELNGFRAALNRVGNNVTQIAKRMNEANKKGMRPPFGTGSLAQMRSLAGFVLDFADQVHSLAERRRRHLSLVVNAALKELADGEE
ncbi:MULTISPECIES: helix-turn-helix domain-containing protein [Rhodobacterales]|uniref:Bacterial mobilization protein (MobC) n=1 Tax=Phaeobacter piscinae TaxID=1580596 RepID=A0ABN5DLM6_9RHOB|nr:MULTISPECIES: helix-turn-helix domain-containing protein [Rhodobacterales]ATG37971.1 Bacterial mobilization protein (MobC) [Phaeobacter piscinae]AUQ88492.1 Bacterial mobilization protein (MobC) [Phaeobacter piscinae]